MTILDELAAMARERHYGHGEREFIERAVCYISKLPVDWCLGCKRGFHKFTQQPLRGSEPEEIISAEVAPIEITPADVTPPVVKFDTIDLEQSLKDGIDHARDPDYCPRCTPVYGTCRCHIASNE